MHRWFAPKALSLAACAAAGLMLALPTAARADGEAGSGVGVARISVLEGAVTVQRGDGATATAAVINAPVLGADYVSTGPGARSEVQFDSASAVRLGPSAQLRFTRIDAADRALQLAEGTIVVRLLRTTEARTRIDTPSISVRPRTAGSYRIAVDAAGATRVTVRSGRADIVTQDGLQVLAPGTTLVASGPAASPAISSLAAIAYDDFDTFNAERDRREERALANAYAPPGVAGIEDLDAYGRWVSDASYGTVWTPSYVAPGWAPYRDGRWVWENGYGWTWIGYEPWGWAPYHYGRWYQSPRYGWCWVPARAVVAWSPALVGFMTFGNSGFGFTTIGWAPLAPFETFTPWWGPGGTTVVNVTNVYVVEPPHHHHRGPLQRPFFKNWRDGGTAVAKQRFLEGRFDRHVALTPDRLNGAQALHGTVPLAPSAANQRLSDRPVAPVIVARRPQPPSLVAVPVDSWARFATTRGGPVRPVTVITGTAVTTAKPGGEVRATAPVARSAHDTPAWSRFDSASGTRGAAPREATVIREPITAREQTRGSAPGQRMQYVQPAHHAQPAQYQPAQYAQPVQHEPHAQPATRSHPNESRPSRSTSPHP